MTVATVAPTGAGRAGPSGAQDTPRPWSAPSQAIERRGGAQYSGIVELRSLPNGTKRLNGLAVPYGQWSEDLGGFRERFLPGSLSDSIARDDIRALFNHESGAVLGRTSAGTLRLQDGRDGLRYEVDLPDTTMGHDVAVMIGRRDVSGNSFGFAVRDQDQEWEERDGLMWRTVRKARLFELGPQPFPAYPQTTLDARSLEAVLSTGRRMAKQRPVTVAELRREIDAEDAKVIAMVEAQERREILAELWDSPERNEIRRIAIHEAAHCVVAAALGGRTERVWLNLEEGVRSWGGWGMQVMGGGQRGGGPCAATSWAGVEGELLGGFDEADALRGSAGDQRRAREAKDATTDEEDRAKARRILERNVDALSDLATALATEGMLDGDRVDEILRGRLRGAA